MSAAVPDTPRTNIPRTDIPRTDTRSRILDAAVATLAAAGYSRTTARAVARAGGFAPGVIYYHFADLDDLFVATAEYTSTQRMVRYRAATDGLTSAVALVHRLRELYREDQSSGHLAAVQELVAAASASPRLADQVRGQGALWQALAEDLIRAQIEGQLFAPLVPVKEIASAAVGAYLGLEMLSHLDAERSAPEEIFDAILPAAVMADSIRDAPDD